jgi:hypothetical protein
MNISNMTWSQAFKECNDRHREHLLRMKITNELFPREDGKTWENWIGLDENSRNKVYEALTVSSLY